MCLLIRQPKNKVVSDEKLQISYENNDDGAGFSYARNGKVYVEKFRDFGKFLTNYKLAVERFGKTSDFVVHFRLQTHRDERRDIQCPPIQSQLPSVVCT